MSSVILPNRQDAPNYSFQTDLDGNTYGFTFYWNDRDNAWYFDLYDTNADIVIAGVKVVLGLPLCAKQRYLAGMFPGMLEVIDTAGSGALGDGVDAGLSDLGTRVVLMYTPIADVRAALGV